ncbi:alpha/beta-Hydrolases superfamily protein [Striga hermonthica]|uniref:Alpha/beta-Hydrolases superfamily protein n=1 Tax=Striga hermonthica TaxID=68872 RepID=A0A9N7MUW2_STRHE|nr:alpha/beta-Hydrolases superfamily protein [Striga hermonthica]
MASFLQRPVLAASAFAIASVSADKLSPFISLEQSNPPLPPLKQTDLDFSWVSLISKSKLPQFSFVHNFHVPMPNLLPTPILNPNSNHSFVSSSSLVLLNSYQSADLTKSAKPAAYPYIKPALPSDLLYKWHLPDPSTVSVGKPSCLSAKSRTVVVLVGWLGAKQKHLNRYAAWYTSRGFHVITFTFPMWEVIGYKVGGKAERDVELLVDHLAEWLEEEHGKNLVFHTFSNTGWLTYGVILEKFQKKDSSLTDRIRGCIVDSAPVDNPDPQVFASGFSAAFLKKNSVATKGSVFEPDVDVKVGERTSVELSPALTEAALLVILEKLFGVVLNQPSINQRLCDVLSVLKSKQPRCPQLYIYSSADRVIPAAYVESFIENQRKSGREVRALPIGDSAGHQILSSADADRLSTPPNTTVVSLTRHLSIFLPRTNGQYPPQISASSLPSLPESNTSSTRHHTIAAHRRRLLRPSKIRRNQPVVCFLQPAPTYNQLCRPQKAVPTISPPAAAVAMPSAVTFAATSNTSTPPPRPTHHHQPPPTITVTLPDFRI